MPPMTKISQSGEGAQARPVAWVSFNTVQDSQSLVTRITRAADVVFPFVPEARYRTPLLPLQPPARQGYRRERIPCTLATGFPEPFFPCFYLHLPGRFL